jgi:hypothetical protein
MDLSELRASRMRYYRKIDEKKAKGRLITRNT